MTPATQFPAVQSLSTVDAVRSTPAQAAIVTVLLLVLITKVVLQVATRRPPRRALHVLDVVIAPLLILFAIIVLQRFSDLSYRDAVQRSVLQIGGEGPSGRAAGPERDLTGRFCCSMYWRNTASGAPPTDPARSRFAPF